MPAFALRFVGQEALPPRLSDFDLEQFFTLLSDEVAGRKPESMHAISADQARVIAQIHDIRVQSGSYPSQRALASDSDSPTALSGVRSPTR